MSMKLSVYAKKAGVRYETAWRWFKQGLIGGQQLANGTIIVDNELPPRVIAPPAGVAIYARVSAAENRPDLENQAKRLVAYCTAKGYTIEQVIKEVGSGVNESRPKFLKLLADPAMRIIVVEHKNRATRFGFRYLETLLTAQGRRIEVVNLADTGKEDLLGDLVAIVYSFAARLYGQRRAKQKTAFIKSVLESAEGADATGGTAPH